VTVSGDEEVAMSVFDGGDVLDHQMEEAQKGTPVLPHFQYTRVSFKLPINRSRLTHFEQLIVFRLVHSILFGSSLRISHVQNHTTDFSGFLCCFVKLCCMALPSRM
jgi:hypothetical protein